ncbi:small conductance mechanosensitive channel [Chitinophaga skermanii]|uniref:Small conductance mechanosensitive channel n=1 Tax=Chitinophaga skermanii TaxID=331697 RepID=A0A327QFY4_9BACT|nr:mechanosensitive ion channel domain-containing protein [Chitinophaga skermanii]RAJ02542.1 small conductance mechanosensitive channel [Chitinophaga skermanii]
MDTPNLELYINRMVNWAADFTPRLIGAVLTLVIGLWVIKKIEQLLIKIMHNKGHDVSLQSFLRSLVSIGLKILLIISVAGMIGFQSTSLVAVIGAAGLAVGLALQGSLANFAGGVLILMFKPFKVGEIVTIQGITGVVAEIQIFSTVLHTGDGKIAILPNGAVSNGNIINSSRTGKLRVDLTVKVAFDEDFEKVKKIILDELDKDKRILVDPPAQISILDYADGNMTLIVRPQAKIDDYWGVYFDAYQNIQRALVEHKVRGPLTVNKTVSA